MNKDKSNRNKDEFLGIAYGTACNKLRKMIMFDLLKQLNKNFCYRCGKEIKNINDLSIEHKKPWLYIGKDLFWDLNNIAFSHLKCNKPNRQSGGDKRVGNKNPRSKKYIVTTPEGKEIFVHGIANFCKNYKKEELGHRRLIEVANKKRKHHKRYKCKYY